MRNYIGGQFVDGNGAQYLDVTNPAFGTVISRVPLSGGSEVDRAVQAAKRAQPAWAAMPIKERVQIFFRYKTLLEKNIDELSALVTEENGKIESEGRAEVLKSAELWRCLTCSPLGASFQPCGSQPSGGDLRKKDAITTTAPWMIPHWMKAAW